MVEQPLEKLVFGPRGAFHRTCSGRSLAGGRQTGRIAKAGHMALLCAYAVQCGTALTKQRETKQVLTGLESQGDQRQPAPHLPTRRYIHAHVCTGTHGHPLMLLAFRDPFSALPSTAG